MLCLASEIRSDAISTMTEALQNSLVGSCGVGRHLCWSSRGRAWHARIEANLKGSPARHQMMELSVSKLGVQCL